MTTRDELYGRTGRALELSQLLEKEVGTALLALDALATKSHLLPNPDQYLRLRDAIEKQTLGQSLKQMRERLKLQEDLEAVLKDSLAARNDLAHRFFTRHGLKVIEPEGRTEMLTNLNGLIVALEQGYGLAGSVARALVVAVQAEVKNAA
jgi:hypothetical protein